MHGGSRRDLLVHGAFHTLGNHVACQICGHGAGQRIIGIVLMPDGIGGVGLLQLQSHVEREVIVHIAVANTGAIQAQDQIQIHCRIIRIGEFLLRERRQICIRCLPQIRAFHIVTNAAGTGKLGIAVGIHVCRFAAKCHAEEILIENVVGKSSQILFRPAELYVAAFLCFIRNVQIGNHLRMFLLEGFQRLPAYLFKNTILTLFSQLITKFRFCRG